ncbi:MAG: tRNA (N6-threonylcarbamoyladenosine(37)-N6)-methyltransferase TrmO [Clostridia bacterium]|nr:tRNA (N6-threonylcarbamoyladenosine(37)-N6)-methyltransferase TrmO [Clostridia bacterium]
MEITPVATIYTPYTTKFGIPRQSGLLEGESCIVFEKAFRSPESVRGLDGFSHVWLLWGFSEAAYVPGTLTVRPPRLGGNRRVGVFASRSPYRPNSMGLSCVKLLRVDLACPDAPVLYVDGADMLSGTPIYDIKPYLSFTDCVPDAVNGYAEAVRDQNVSVRFSCDVSALEDDAQKKLAALLANDPRPHYQNDPQRVYAFEFDGLHVEFTQEDGSITVRRVTAV